MYRTYRLCCSSRLPVWSCAAWQGVTSCDSPPKQQPIVVETQTSTSDWGFVMRILTLSCLSLLEVNPLCGNILMKLMTTGLSWLAN